MPIVTGPKTPDTFFGKKYPCPWRQRPFSRTGDKGDRGDTEEKWSTEGRHAEVTGETEIHLQGMPVTSCLPLCHTWPLSFPFVSPLSPLSHLKEERVGLERNSREKGGTDLPSACRE